ncbi:hypothetical protein ACFXAW_01600 [Streptomyces sp. NPDC059445]|uniref:hypothetical protein n=1 Tax=Streptomyces sp. NPDC059445 TaxID=3346832 RepID=UPI0036B281E2
MTASLACRKTRSLEAGTVYAWESIEGATGHLLIDPGETLARPCTPEGIPLGETRLDKNVGTVENPDPNPELRRAFLTAAAAVLRETERQGHLPDRVTRTFW